MLKLKKLQAQERVATLTFHRDCASDPFLKALAVLLGGYNKYGRNIPLATHYGNVEELRKLLEKVAEELEES